MVTSVVMGMLPAVRDAASGLPQPSSRARRKNTVLTRREFPDLAGFCRYCIVIA
jgi:hypothetical protein